MLKPFSLTLGSLKVLKLFSRVEPCVLLQVKAVTLDEKRRVASSVVVAGGDVDLALFAPEPFEEAKVLALSQSIRSRQFGETTLFPAAKLTNLYHTPSMST
jgi:hypothetical protein